MTRRRSSGDILTGWKVMRFDPERGTAISGADARQRVTPLPGEDLAMPGGIWLGLDRAYVETHYAVHDHNVTLELRFARADILSGRPEDREAELRVRRARILGTRTFP